MFATRFAFGPHHSDYFFLRDRDDFRGTLAPFFRASFRPMAIACFRLFTRRPDPLLSVPFFFRCSADLTRLPDDLPYLAMGLDHASAVLTRRRTRPWPKQEPFTMH